MMNLEHISRLINAEPTVLDMLRVCRTGNAKIERQTFNQNLFTEV